MAERPKITPLRAALIVDGQTYELADDANAVGIADAITWIMETGRNEEQPAESGYAIPLAHGELLWVNWQAVKTVVMRPGPNGPHRA